MCSVARRIGDSLIIFMENATGHPRYLPVEYFKGVLTLYGLRMVCPMESHDVFYMTTLGISDGISHTTPYWTCHGTLPATSNEHATGHRIKESTHGVSDLPRGVLLLVVSGSPLPVTGVQLGCSS